VRQHRRCLRGTRPEGLRLILPGPPVIRIEIVYAQPQHRIIKALQLAPGSTIADALAAAAADHDFFGVDLAQAAVGIFGKVARREQALKDGDRIEIYRPLREEPKLARRKRLSKCVRS
jgi:putative ubiquitin-RnfH superfamily antitoxin RatB of RatAB toxin-antitoxin module